MRQEEEIEELKRWWMETAQKDFEMMLPRLNEYGAKDLEVMGRMLGELIPIEQAATGQELACWLYLLGKVARLASNYHQGKPGKGDSLIDATIYSLMARRIQEVGGWPWG